LGTPFSPPRPPALADAMKKRRIPPKARAVRTLDIPLPAEPRPLEEVLASRLGSNAAARRAIVEVAGEFGVPADSTQSVSAALALTRLGCDVDRIARSLAWREFEDYCAMAISAAGYAVSRNVRLRKPTRQIDIVAESPSLVLSVDCKHWQRSAGAAGLAGPALAQAERTRLYVERSRNAGTTTFLPVLLTMVENQVRVVEGVPIVPLQALREFLSSVSRFDEGFSFIRDAPRR
jgi:Restriction endonuclease